VGVLLQPTPAGDGIYLQWILSGMGWTIALALSSWSSHSSSARWLETLRVRGGRLAAALGRVYVELFRNIPLLVQMFLWVFVLPEIMPRAVWVISSRI